MAINWTMKTAMDAILKNDKESLMDIGKRFPLAFKALVEAQANVGAVTICNALEDLTVRKLESVLKDGVAEKSDADTDDETETEEKPKATEKKSGRGRPSKKKEEPVDEVEDEEDDPVALYKQCKKAGIEVKPRQSAKYYKDALAKANEADDEDDWDDDEEEEKPKKKAEKPAKSKKKADPEPEDDEEDDDDWDI